MNGNISDPARADGRGRADSGWLAHLAVGRGRRGLEAAVSTGAAALRYDRPLIEAVPCGAQRGGMRAGPGPTGGEDRARAHSTNNNCPSVHEAARATCHEAPQ
jgi:hypothetical protein